MSFTVYPAVDIAGGRCVRLLQGRFGSETVYSDDPVEVALGFCRAGARRLHVVDLDGAKTGVSENRELVLEVARRATCPVQAGGGLRSVDDVEQVLRAGARWAVLGTIALEDRGALRRACNRYGDQVAISLDVRGTELSSHGWTVGTGMRVLDAVELFETVGVSRFIYTDVSRDGTMTGPNLQGVARLAQATSIPVIASGGISTLDDVRAVARLSSAGVVGVIVGRALYEQRFDVSEANAAADRAAAAQVQEDGAH